MKVALSCGLDRVEFDVRDEAVLAANRHPQVQPVADVQSAVREAIENPIDFLPLRRALTPQDRIAVVVDEELPDLGSILTPIIEHITSAQVDPSDISLVCPASNKTQPWLDDIPDAYQDVRLEMHNPSERNHLAYLATTQRGRRIYVNRTVVDADQIIVLTGRRYDPLFGVAGAETLLFPTLSDAETRTKLGRKLSIEPVTETPWPIRQEAIEVCGLLGMPFFVQVIEGVNPDVLHVVAGLSATTHEGLRLLDECWRVEVDAHADCVIASIGGDPKQHQLIDVARAFASASRIVKPNGRIFLLSAASPEQDETTRMLSTADEPEDVLTLLHEQKLPNMEAAFLWAHAARQASLYLLSGMPEEVAEELFTTPVHDLGEVQRRLSGDERFVFLPDAHKTMAVVRD